MQEVWVSEGQRVPAGGRDRVRAGLPHKGQLTGVAARGGAIKTS